MMTIAEMSNGTEECRVVSKTWRLLLRGISGVVASLLWCIKVHDKSRKIGRSVEALEQQQRYIITVPGNPKEVSSAHQAKTHGHYYISSIVYSYHD